MKSILIGIIRIYQKTRPVFCFPSLLGFYGGCRFSPTCSDYSVMAIEKNGLLNGLARAVLRVLRCGPWSKGGLDLP